MVDVLVRVTEKSMVPRGVGGEKMGERGREREEREKVE